LVGYLNEIRYPQGLPQAVEQYRQLQYPETCQYEDSDIFDLNID